MRRLPTLTLAALALVSCKKIERRPTTWTGIEADAPKTCAWNHPNSYREGSTGTCISRGRAFACVYDPNRNHVECAPVSAPPTAEAP